MDFDSIPPGVDFRDHIRQTIEPADVVAVIGPHWLGDKSPAKRRIDDANDFVRLEIAHAFQRAIPVVPVLVNNTQMPTPDNLPDDLQSLAFRNALPLDSGIDFHQHAERLIAGIQKTARTAPGRPRIVRRQLLYITVGLIVITGLTSVLWWYFGRSNRTSVVTQRREPQRAQSTSAVSPSPQLQPALEDRLQRVAVAPKIPEASPTQSSITSATSLTANQPEKPAATQTPLT